MKKNCLTNLSIISRMLFQFLLVIFLSSCSDDDFQPPPPDPGGGNGTGGVEESLPLIEIITAGQIVDEPKVRGNMKIIEGEQVSYQGIVGIELRGASSLWFDKKSYGLETWNSKNEDINVSLLGMPEEEDWVLHGPFSDKSLMRNKLIYDLARDMGRYASRTKFVELRINGDRQGVYVFMEKLKRNRERIAISKLLPTENSGEDLTGGYILKIDKISGSNLGDGYNQLNSFASRVPPRFAEASQVKFLYEYPDAEELTDQQRAYISNYVHDFEAALASDDFRDPVKGYKSYVDLESFVDFFILNEISHNVDGYRLSTYMHKDKNGKLQMGPIWDFNLAFGNADYCGGGNTDTWAYKFNERCPGDYWPVPFWWYRLMEDPEFRSLLKSRWKELRSGVLSASAIEGRIAEYEASLNLKYAADRNFGIWQIIGVYIWPNNYVGNTYTAEKIYLKSWLRDRMNWLDGAINRL